MIVPTRVLLALVVAVWLGIAPAGSSVAAEAGDEEMAWALIHNTSDPDVLESFLIQFPDGVHAAEAQAKRDALTDRGTEIGVPEPSVPPSNVAVGPDATEMAVLVQAELTRAGCDPGGVDGAWGNGSRAALARFAKAAGLTIGATEPSAELLAILKARPGKVCTGSTTSTATTAAPAAPTGGCYTVSVAYDPNIRWDPIGPLAEPSITETTTGAHAKCKETNACSLTVHPTGSSINISAYDADSLSGDDFAGGGTCALGKTCVLGHVTVSSSRC